MHARLGAHRNAIKIPVGEFHWHFCWAQWSLKILNKFPFVPRGFLEISVILYGMKKLASGNFVIR
jgi:hypothetical protein